MLVVIRARIGDDDRAVEHGRTHPIVQTSRKQSDVQRHLRIGDYIQTLFVSARSVISHPCVHIPVSVAPYVESDTRLDQRLNEPVTAPRTDILVYKSHVSEAKTSYPIIRCLNAPSFQHFTHGSEEGQQRIRNRKIDYVVQYVFDCLRHSRPFSLREVVSGTDECHAIPSVAKFSPPPVLSNSVEKHPPSGQKND